MIILTIRTDKPEAELGLYQDREELNYSSWQAHRALAETIHIKIKELLDKSDLELSKVEGIVVFKGPGSFTGLRIGISVANTLADSLTAPIAAKTGDRWKDEGIADLLLGKNEKISLPDYGAPPKTTQQKK